VSVADNRAGSGDEQARAGSGAAAELLGNDSSAENSSGMLIATQEAG